MNNEKFQVPDNFKNPIITEELYQQWYQESIHHPQAFWAKRANEFLSWDKTWDRVSDWDYRTAEIKWFSGAKLNVSYNCVDRHLPTRANQVAIIWEGNSPEETRKITYQELYDQINLWANLIKEQGVAKGDRVAIYMPMIPEIAYAMLACTRIGAVHTVIFGGFSAESIRDRLNDCQCKLVITANAVMRGAKKIELKKTVDQATLGAASVKKIIVVKRLSEDCPMQADRDLWASEGLAKVKKYCQPESMDSEDPLFILYTSGSTGKPKGVLHTQAGYLLYAAMTHKYVFDYQPGQIHFCTADAGWITGHSYVVYGPLANGATTVMFEGLPTFPDAGRYWQIVEKHKVNIFYTAPTAIRALAKEGDQFVTKYNRQSLRVLGSVGEPINRDAWLWYNQVVGEGRCPIVDTWWQTETGGILITPLPGANFTKPGSATRPFFGIQPCLVDEAGKEIHDQEARGRLCLKAAWPGQMRTVYGNHSRFIDTYFKDFPGFYFTGDAAIRDQDGYYWITGRVDDVLNVSGHRIGTAEIESAIVASGIVAEAAVVGRPHDIKGTGICAFCIPRTAQDCSIEAVKAAVRQGIGGFAIPDEVIFVPGLPKTRSGKIMRRILRKIAEGEREELGDLTTLADPAVVAEILARFK